LGEIGSRLSKMSGTSSSAQPKEKFSLVDFSLKLEKLLPVDSSYNLSQSLISKFHQSLAEGI
jgi:hypothetical protein